MPPRLSRTTIRPTPNAPAHRKRKSRALDAYAIAAAEDPVADRVRIRQHRLGETEDENPKRKKARLHDAGEDVDVPRASEGRRQRMKSVKKGGVAAWDYEEEDDDEGEGEGQSGSEGEWRVGVGEGEDSEVESEEAFGSSDGEKFEGFIFRGSRDKSGSKKRQREEEKSIEVDLDEDEDNVAEEQSDEDDFGDEGVDLATMLDDDENDEDNDGTSGDESLRGANATSRRDRHATSRSKTIKIGEETFDEDEFGGFEGDGSEADEDLDVEDESSDNNDDRRYATSSDDEQDGSGPEDIQRIQDMVAALPRGKKLEDKSEQAIGKSQSNPTAASLLASLKRMPSIDPSLSRSIKKLSQNMEPSTAKEKLHGVVSVPLPKRQQDRLDRESAYEKAKETLNRWLDTVKHNRRAEHLSFPLQDPEAQEPQGASRLMPTNAEKPQTELESTIQNILKENGLGSKSGNADEEKLLQEEELQANKMPYEEVIARRAELRKARELLFREEVRAKRIKKIKSKAYRRIHRKDLRKAEQRERDLLAAAGLELSDNEKEKNDRRRAEERMGARHRESKWAKGAKKAGRTIWDEDVREGMIEMAKKNDELRKRMESKTGGSSDDGLGSDRSGESSDDDEDDEETSQFRLREDLDRVSGDQSSNFSTSKLGSMKFMQQAEAARKKRNDETIEKMRREIDGEHDSDDASEEDRNVGRRLFGPSQNSTNQPQPQRRERGEFEEREDSADESFDEYGALKNALTEEQNLQQQSSTPDSTQRVSKLKKRLDPPATARPYQEKVAEITSTQDENAHTSTTNLPPSDSENGQELVLPDTNGWTHVHYGAQEETAPDSTEHENDQDAEDGNGEPFIPSNLDLVRAAFGVDDDAETQFNAEKASAVESEDEQFEDNALPGWGSWTGEGISKRAQKKTKQRNAGRFVTKTQDGVKPADRKDVKLDKVIISEKRAKKNAKYLSSSLPHPFESRQQYERSLRIPVGPEWTTKESFQNATKPRVMVKQGIIRPMEKPLV